MRTWLRAHPRSSLLGLVAVTLLAVWLAELTLLVRGVDRARDYWSQPRGEPGGLLYVALGDSAAQGVGASSPERGYVGLLAARLREATGRPVEVVNLSASGARIEDVLRDQLPRLRELDADLVTVAVGGNDVRALDLRSFEREVDALTAALPEGTLVADVPYFMHGRWEREADDAAALVRRSAVEQGLVVVPLHEALRDQGWTAMLTQFAADWFHPNDRGHRVWAEAFWEALTASSAAERLGLRADG